MQGCLSYYPARVNFILTASPRVADGFGTALLIALVEGAGGAGGAGDRGEGVERRRCWRARVERRREATAAVMKAVMATAAEAVLGDDGGLAVVGTVCVGGGDDGSG